MSYIGNQPTSVAFLTDTFSGNASATTFTLSAAPATTSSIIVAVSGVLQDPSTYSVSGTTLTFSAAPPTGTDNISVRFLGIPASGVTTTAYRTVTEFTATAGQTTFSVPSYTVGYIDVYQNGVLLGSADYTATNGTTVVLAAGATAGDLVETISFYVSSVLNAIPATAGAVNSTYITDGAITPAKLSTGGPSWTSGGALTITNQPMISAWHNANEAPASGSPIVNWTLTTNNGGGTWNSGTATYTVPVTGNYMIMLSLLNSAGTNPGGGIFLRINGSNTGRIIYVTTDAGYLMGSGSIILPLTASSTVQFIQETSSKSWYGDAAGLGSFTINMLS